MLMGKQMQLQTDNDFVVLVDVTGRGAPSRRWLCLFPVLVFLWQSLFAWCLGFTHNPESLERAEGFRFALLILQIFRIYEEAYYGQLHGQLDERAWRDLNVPMRVLLGYPGIERSWRYQAYLFNEEFVKHIDQLQQDTKRFRIGGEVFQRIRYGQEKEGVGADRQPCSDCNVSKGGLHSFGCDLERCPRCNGQAVYCECPYDQRSDQPFAFLRLSVRSR